MSECVISAVNCLFRVTDITMVNSGRWYDLGFFMGASSSLGGSGATAGSATGGVQP